MQGHIINYARGSVWICEDDDFETENLRKGFRTHVQRKTRPVIIISDNYGNSHSPVVNVIPLTTQDKRSAVAVAICKEDGTLCCALCNQIKTVDKRSLVNCIGFADEETIAEIEKTLQYALGIKQPKIAQSLEDLEKLIQNIITMKFNDLSNRGEFDDIVQKVANGLESNYKMLMEGYIQNLNKASDRLRKSAPTLSNISEIKSAPKTAIATATIPENKPIIPENKPKKRNYTSHKKPAGYWTTERMQSYISDYNKQSVNYMMVTYELDTEAQVEKQLSTCKYRLKKAGIEI